MNSRQLAVMAAFVLTLAVVGAVSFDTDAADQELEKVTVDNEVIIDRLMDVSGKEITFGGSGKYTVKSGASLMLNGQMRINATGTAIVFESGSSLVLMGQTIPFVERTELAVDGTFMMQSVLNIDLVSIALTMDIGGGDTLSLGGSKITGGDGAEMKVEMSSSLDSSGSTVSKAVVTVDIPKVEISKASAGGFTVKDATYNDVRLDMQSVTSEGNVVLGGTDGGPAKMTIGSASQTISMPYNGTEYTIEGTSKDISLSYSGTVGADGGKIDLDASMASLDMTVGTEDPAQGKMAIALADARIGFSVDASASGATISGSDGSVAKVTASSMSGSFVQDLGDDDRGEMNVEAKGFSAEFGLSTGADPTDPEGITGLNAKVSLDSASLEAHVISDGKKIPLADYSLSGLEASVTSSDNGFTVRAGVDRISVESGSSISRLAMVSVLRDITLDDVDATIVVDRSGELNDLEATVSGFTGSLNLLGTKADVSGRDVQIDKVGSEIKMAVDAVDVKTGPGDYYTGSNTSIGKISISTTGDKTEGSIASIESEQYIYDGSVAKVSARNLTSDSGVLRGDFTYTDMPVEADLYINVEDGMNVRFVDSWVSDLTVEGGTVSGNVLIDEYGSITYAGGDSLWFDGYGMYAEVELAEDGIDSATIELLEGYYNIPEYSGEGAKYERDSTGMYAEVTEFTGAIFGDADRLTFNVTASGKDQVVVYKELVQVPAPADAPEGCVFFGWFDGKEISDGEGYVLLEPRNVTLQPIWAQSPDGIVSGKDYIVESSGSYSIHLSEADVNAMVSEATAANADRVILRANGVSMTMSLSDFTTRGEMSFIVQDIYETGTNMDSVSDRNAKAVYFTSKYTLSIPMTMSFGAGSGGDMLYKVSEYGVSAEMPDQSATDNGDGTSAISVEYAPSKFATAAFYVGSPDSPGNGGNTMLYIGIAAVLIVVIAIAAFVMTRKKGTA